MFVIKKDWKYLSNTWMELTSTIKEARTFDSFKEAKETGDSLFEKDYEICEVELLITKNFHID